MENWSDWAHVITSMRGQWLPGDARGFKSRAHRIHSSGDYRNPPPRGEHAGLRVYAKRIAHDPIVLTPAQCETVGSAVIAKLEMMHVPLSALCVAPTHMHALICVGQADAVPVLGRAKQAASHVLRDELPGRIWGQSSNVVRIRSRDHAAQTRKYILDHVNEGAWVYDPVIAA